MLDRWRGGGIHARFGQLPIGDFARMYAQRLHRWSDRLATFLGLQLLIALVSIAVVPIGSPHGDCLPLLPFRHPSEDCFSYDVPMLGWLLLAVITALLLMLFWSQRRRALHLEIIGLFALPASLVATATAPGDPALPLQWLFVYAGLVCLVNVGSQGALAVRSRRLYRGALASGYEASTQSANSVIENEAASQYTGNKGTADSIAAGWMLYLIFFMPTAFVAAVALAKIWEHRLPDSWQAYQDWLAVHWSTGEPTMTLYLVMLIVAALLAVAWLISHGTGRAQSAIHCRAAQLLEASRLPALRLRRAKTPASLGTGASLGAGRMRRNWQIGVTEGPVEATAGFGWGMINALMALRGAFTLIVAVLHLAAWSVTRSTAWVTWGVVRDDRLRAFPDFDIRDRTPLLVSSNERDALHRFESIDFDARHVVRVNAGPTQLEVWQHFESPLLAELGTGRPTNVRKRDDTLIVLINALDDEALAQATKRLEWLIPYCLREPRVTL